MGFVERGLVAWCTVSWMEVFHGMVSEMTRPLMQNYALIATPFDLLAIHAPLQLFYVPFTVTCDAFSVFTCKLSRSGLE